MMRLLTSLFLTLSLGLTSLTIAQARGASAVTGQMVICSGMGTKIVYVDAEGQPTQAPHICPDCLIVLALDRADTPLTPTYSNQRAIFVAQLSERVPSPLKDRTPPTRAPPLNV